CLRAVRPRTLASPRRESSGRGPPALPPPSNSESDGRRQERAAACASGDRTQRARPARDLTRPVDTSRPRPWTWPRGRQRPGRLAPLAQLALDLERGQRGLDRLTARVALGATGDSIERLV